MNSIATRFCIRLWLLLLLCDYWGLLNSLCRDRRRCVQALDSYLCRLYALRSYWCRLDTLGADLCRRQTNPIHCHQLHVVQVDSRSHSHSSLCGQGWTRSLRSDLEKIIVKKNKQLILTLALYYFAHCTFCTIQLWQINIKKNYKK